MAKKERAENKRKQRAEFFLDLISWVPELLILPFRLLIWLLRGLASLVRSVLGNW